MSTNVSKLKRGKGAPPPADTTPDVIADNPRSETTEMKALQVRIPSDVFADFSETAGREFGFSHGAKKQMFLKIWEAYKARKA